MRTGLRVACAVPKQPTTKAAPPSHFLSLYRLFLRTTAASVLHHKHATYNLRALFRSTFDDAASVIKSSPERDAYVTEAWLKEWDRRVDGTLSLLHSSAQSRGLSHKLTSNIAFFVLGRYQSLLVKNPTIWNPSLPPDSPAYTPRKNKAKATAESNAFDDALGPVLEAIKMAEARQSLILGPLPAGRKRFSKTLLEKLKS